MKKLLLPIALLPALVGNGVFAADHKDGQTVQEHPAADITDLFAFPRTDAGGAKRLTLIMSTLPDASQDAVFDNAIHYRFRMRPVTGFQNDPFKAQVSDEEFGVYCQVFGQSLQELACRLLHDEDGSGESTVLTTARVNTRDPSGGSNPDMKIFAGPRADQLFTDRARVRMPVWRDTGYSDSEEWPGVNTFLNNNVLSIVVDLDVEKFLQFDSHLLAVAGETLMTDAAHSVPYRIDRMGRVEITVFFIDVVDPDTRFRELWNADDTFALNPENVPLYRNELQLGLERMDAFELSLTEENVLDWPQPHPWLELLIDDFLVLDLNHPTAPSSTEVNYLGIETAYFRGDASQVVGGRLPNENVIERTLTYFINGLDRPEPNRGVGVDEPAAYTVDRCPFVPPPHESEPQSEPQGKKGRY